MPITINGTGSIEGLSAGGLPDGSVTASELAAGAINSQALALLNASGSAPVFAARAWVNFNGTGTVSIRSSGNVSSISDNGVGDYTVNFTTAMPDANYVPVFSWADAPPNNTTSPKILSSSDRGAATLKSTSQYRMVSNNFDAVELYSAVFR